MKVTHCAENEWVGRITDLKNAEESVYARHSHYIYGDLFITQADFFNGCLGADRDML